jgi:hypothetical protein
MSVALVFSAVSLPALSAPVPADYFVRANMANGGLSIDDATSISGSRSGALGSTATGSADLGQGTLRAYADANDPANTIGAWVDFGDTITVLGLLAPTTVTLQMRVHGTLSDIARASARLQVGDSLTCTDVVCGLVAGIVDDDYDFWEPPDSFLEVDQVLSVSRQVGPGNATFAFYADLIISANGPTGVSDFGNTATMNLILPSGLSFTSGSGVFLTAPSSVPEPGALGLVLMGLGALLVGRRRHVRAIRFFDATVEGATARGQAGKKPSIDR